MLQATSDCISCTYFKEKFGGEDECDYMTKENYFSKYIFKNIGIL